MEALAVQEPSKFKMSFAMWVGLLVLIVFGAVGFYMVSIEDSTRAWFNYLIGSVIFLGLGLSGLFFTMIQHVVGAKWSVAVRRIFEAMAMTLPVSALMFVGVYFGIHHLYEWSHVEIHGKATYLEEGFFSLRLVAYFVIWLGATFLVVGNSLRQDSTGNIVHTHRNFRNSAIGLTLFAVASTMAGFDILMSLEPHWFSTMYGVHFFASFFQAGLAVIYLVAWRLYKSGVLTNYINKHHFHDIGKFLFAFSVFWAYITFSQFMLYWYGDIPEHTIWFRARSVDGWGIMGIAIFLIRWAVPFFILLPVRNKMNFKVAVPICFVVLFGHWLDVYWNAMPAARLMYHSMGAEAGHHLTAMFQWQDLATGVGFTALFFLVLGVIMERIRMVPVQDPRLEESIHHHG